MDILLQFGVGAAQRITYDFLKLLILLPIAIIIDLIIKAVKKNIDKKNPKKTNTRKNNTKSSSKKLTKADKERIKKSDKKTKIALWILFWLYVAPVICLVTSSLATVMFGSADVAAPTAIATLAIIIVVLLYIKWSKDNG